MGDTLYIKIKPQIRYLSSSRHFRGLSMEAVTFRQSLEIRHRNCPVHALATCWELLFALFCSLITSSYTFRHEVRDVSPPGLESKILVSDDGYFAFILDPPPALMLGACLVLGCAISSFAYRRQEEDKLQTPIFISAITVATTVGFAIGVNTNLIMLGMIPWALCTAMIFSTAVHWLLRRCNRNASYCEVGCCELGQKENVASSEK